jgi:WD40 repeat protein
MLAKTLFQLRAVRVFRDKTSLSANPALWSAIEHALSESEFFLLLASPQAAASPWVIREVQWWLNNRSVEKMLVLLTEGTIAWNASANDFDWTGVTALPTILAGRFPNEPLYVDLRWARSAESLSLRHSQFRAAILDIAAPLHGRLKDELDGDDVRWHRRTRLLAWSAVTIILIAACVAGWQAYEARLHQRDAEAAREAEKEQRLKAEDATKEANTQRDQATYQKGVAEREAELALARQLAAQAEVLQLQHGSYLPLSVLLAAESTRRTPSPEGEFVMRRGIGLLPRPIAWLPLHSLPLGGAPRRSPCGWSWLAGKEETRDGGVIQVLCAPEIHKKALPLLTKSDLIHFAFSANGEIFGYRDEEATVRFLELTSGREVWHLLVDGLDALAISGTSQYVAVQTSGTSGKVIQAYRFGNSNPVFQEKCECTGREFAVSDDGTLIAASTGLSEEVETIWNIQTHRSEKAIPAQSFITWHAAFSQDNTILAVIDQQDLVLWDLTAKRINRRLHHDGEVSAIAFSPDGKSLATASLDHTARVWSLSSGEELVRMVHDDAVVSVSFSADGKEIFTSGLDRRIAVWESSAGQRSGQILRRDQATEALSDVFGAMANAMSGLPKGQVTVASRNGKYGLLYDFSGPRAYLISLPDKKRLVDLGRAFSARDRQGQFTRDGLYFLMVTPEGRAVEVRRVPDGAVVAILRHTGKVGQFILAKDSGVAITLAKSSAYVWSIPTGRQISVLSHEQDVKSAIFSPDEAAVATLSEDRVLRVWSWREAKELARIVPDEEAEDARFSSNGRFIEMTFSGDRSRRWVWKPDDLIAEVCSRVPHNMTGDEWRQYFGTKPYQKTCPNRP